MTTDLLTPQTVKTLTLEIEQGGDLQILLGVVATQMAITGPTVARSTAYTVGARVIPATPNGYAYDCISAGTTHASIIPAWPVVVGALVTDGTVIWACAGSTSNRDYLFDTSGYTATLEIRQGDYDGDTQLEASTTDGRITVGFTPPKWIASTAYVAGTQVVPLALNGFVYQASVAGTSDVGIEPVWPTTIGMTVLDGTVRWRCEQAENINNGLVSNLVVFVPAAVTMGLTDWGKGVYTLKLIDTYGRTALWLDGEAYLRPQATY